MTTPTVPQPIDSAKTGRKSSPTPHSPELLAALEHLNTRVCVVRALGKVVEYDLTRVAEPNPLSFRSFQYEMYANISSTFPNLASLWVKWKGRKTVSSIVYEPGQPLFFGPNNEYLNTWRPSDLKPKKGDLTIWHQYIDHLFALDPTFRDWFIAWLAYPLQNPGIKLHTACVFWSKETGTGKSTIGYIMEKLYGPHNFKEIEESDLSSIYNHWAVFRSFVMGDEIRGDKAREVANRMKGWITRRTMTVNLKYRAQFDYRDSINYYFTSNHHDAFFLTAQDRRYFVHHVNEVKVSTLMSNRAFNDWLLSGGYSAILHYLLYEVDLSKPIVGGRPDSLDPAPFDPRADAPRTIARQAMIEAGKTEIDVWLEGLLDSDDGTFAGLGWKLATGDDLFAAFNTAFPRANLRYKTFISETKSVLPQVRGGNAVRLKPGTPSKRLYCLPSCISEYEAYTEASLISVYEHGR
jgi:hypothetical protein